MADEITNVLGKGFTAWSNNLILSLPFIFMSLISLIIVMIFFMLVFVAFIFPEVEQLGVDPLTIDSNVLTDLVIVTLLDNITILIIGGIVAGLVIYFVQAYFIAAAIGMIKEIAYTGNTKLTKMFYYGKLYVVNLFLLNIIISLLIFAGIVFTIPGILLLGDITQFIENPLLHIDRISLLVIGILIWIVYALIVTVSLALSEYVLVIEELDPLNSIKTAFNFFMDNKLNVSILWIIIISISFVISIFNEIFVYVELLSLIWSIASVILSIAIIPPLTAAWWTYLYLTLTNKQLYDKNELLSYGELDELESNI